MDRRDFLKAVGVAAEGKLCNSTVDGCVAVLGREVIQAMRRDFDESGVAFGC